MMPYENLCALPSGKVWLRTFVLSFDEEATHPFRRLSRQSPSFVETPTPLANDLCTHRLYITYLNPISRISLILHKAEVNVNIKDIL